MQYFRDVLAVHMDTVHPENSLSIMSERFLNVPERPVSFMHEVLYAAAQFDYILFVHFNDYK